MTFVAIWRFTTNDRSAFEQLYGPQGEWARLFRLGEGYLSTELLVNGDVYVTFDWWRSHEDYSRFRELYASEYAVLDATGEAITATEEKVGEFVAVSSR